MARARSSIRTPRLAVLARNAATISIWIASMPSRVRAAVSLERMVSAERGRIGRDDITRGREQPAEAIAPEQAGDTAARCRCQVQVGGIAGDAGGAVDVEQQPSPTALGTHLIDEAAQRPMILLVVRPGCRRLVGAVGGAVHIDVLAMEFGKDDIGRLPAQIQQPLRNAGRDRRGLKIARLVKWQRRGRPLPVRSGTGSAAPPSCGHASTTGSVPRCRPTWRVLR